LRSQAQGDPHAPDEYRANTILSDLPEFQRSFSCKKDAPMVAPKPCRVW
jgi:endothelin-converting enzyme/putative endopeptidase